MKKITKIMTATLALSMFIFLSGCVATPKESIKNEDIVAGEDSEETKNEEFPVYNEDVGNVELSLGEKSKIAPEDIEEMFGEDMEMLSRFNDFTGRKAPDFEATDLNGDKVKISDFEGENVILEFMGTWCPACQSAALTNEEFNNNNKDAKIISIGFNDDEKSITDFKKSHNIKNTDFLISGEDGIEKYDVFFVPLYVYIDKEGYVQMILAGDAPLEALEEYSVKSFK